MQQGLKYGIILIQNFFYMETFVGAKHQCDTIGVAGEGTDGGNSPLSVGGGLGGLPLENLEY